MSNLIALKCISSTPSKNGGHVVKLQNKQEIVLDTPFGKKTQTAQTTFYAKFDNPVAIKSEGELDLDMFIVREQPYIIPARVGQPAIEAVYGANPAQPDPTLPDHMVLITPAQPAIEAMPEVSVPLKWLSLKGY